MLRALWRNFIMRGKIGNLHLAVVPPEMLWLDLSLEWGVHYRCMEVRGRCSQCGVIKCTAKPLDMWVKEEVNWKEPCGWPPECYPGRGIWKVGNIIEALWPLCWMIWQVLNIKIKLPHHLAIWAYTQREQNLYFETSALLCSLQLLTVVKK